MGFPERLTRLLRAKDQTKSGLARLTGISQPAITGMTKGTRRPYLDQGAAIAKALDVSLDHLAFDEEYRPSSGTGNISKDDLVILEIVRSLGLRPEQLAGALLNSDMFVKFGDRCVRKHIVQEYVKLKPSGGQERVEVKLAGHLYPFEIVGQEALEFLAEMEGDRSSKPPTTRP